MNKIKTSRDGTAKSPGGRKVKRVRRSVVIIDHIADRVITVGGIAVILAVLGIMVYLLSQALPLFLGGEKTAMHEYRHDPPAGDILAAGMDEYQTIGYVLFQDGRLRLVHVRTGKELKAYRLDFRGRQLRSYSVSNDAQHFAFGFDDGSVQLAELSFPFEVLPGENLPEGLTTLDENDAYCDDWVYTGIPGGQYRRIYFDLKAEEPIQVNTDGIPIVGVDYRISGEAERKTTAFVTVAEDGAITLTRIRSRVNLLTGDTRKQIETSQLPAIDSRTGVHRVLMNSRADMVLIGTYGGRLFRYNTSDFSRPILAEITAILSDEIRLTYLGFLIGEHAVLVGGNDGSMSAFFLTLQKERGTVDGKALVKAREYARGTSPVNTVMPSSRGKSFAVAYDNGTATLFHGTSQKLLLSFPSLEQTVVAGIALSPRFDGLLQIFADGRVRFWEFSIPHPETTFKTLFQRVWYEGFERPAFVWQSSALDDSYEQKLSLIPLIFGSIKAALYSLLFAVPIAILGAIYTSEFVDHRIRGTIKPAMEMMASLPSVVLGFVAALVLAPIVETWIAAVLAAFLTIPIALILTSFCWQLLPQHLAIRWEGSPKLVLMFVVLILSIAASRIVGPWLEGLFFGGSFKAWLNRDFGTAVPFLFLLLLPIVFLSSSMLLTRWLRQNSGGSVAERSRLQKAGLDVLKWIGLSIVTVLLSWFSAHIIAFFGVDARNGLVGTYVQRNTLVVGFAMGFAVIPIIYTIAEDALHAVPDHLRAASLACGATQWQTTIYVILPAAVSGVFSAVMIGMGRAVGETMIVVMAAGNTPLLDWNVFNGLRALSATIAVELPEAVKDGTLYRVLFLSGLVLFTMTFVINTIAEVVRIRFRKKTTQL
jgi:phosphate transport system permease protein